MVLFQILEMIVISPNTNAADRYEPFFAPVIMSWTGAKNITLAYR
jgi:hypothetical protein